MENNVMENLVPVVYANQRVLTTKQLAEFYGVEPSRIKDNFRHARKRFMAGMDFFKIEGDELRALKEQMESSWDVVAERWESFRSQWQYKSPLAAATRALILYTERGAARHCKMLNTPDALEVFMKLQRDYFDVKTVAPVQSSPFPPVEVRGVHGYVDAEKVAWLNAEDVARGLGFVQTHSERVTTSGDSYSAVRWERVNQYLSEFGYDKQVGKGDYIPENMVYRLAMKANNETARKFQAKIADEIMPSLRRYGFYSTSVAVDAVDIRESQLKLLNMPSHIKTDSELAEKLIALADKIENPDNPNVRDKILIHAANLLVGEKLF